MNMETEQKPPVGVVPKLNTDGSENTKYADVLDEDKSIAGQKFACLSFISPEGILKQKNDYFFGEFLKKWDFSKSMDKFTQFLHFLSYKYNVDFDNITEDLKNFVKEERNNLIKTTVEEEYKNFLDENEEHLEKEFNNQHQFQTSVRGIKVRGVFPTQEEAELRCKLLRETDPNHDVYVGPVGMWVPFHPEAYKTGRVEYMEDTLNQLMHEKKKNESQAKVEFDKRIKEAKMKAIAENKKIAEKSGNKLTQNITKDGKLVGVSQMNTQESELGADASVSTADIRRELFEGENVVTAKNSDHGLSDLENVTFELGDSTDLSGN